MNIIIIHSNSLAAPAISQSSAIGKPNAKGRRCRLVEVYIEQAVKAENNADENEQLCTTMQNSDIDVITASKCGSAFFSAADNQNSSDGYQVIRRTLLTYVSFIEQSDLGSARLKCAKTFILA
jgi:hypothetical protein